MWKKLDVAGEAIGDRVLALQTIFSKTYPASLPSGAAVFVRPSEGGASFYVTPAASEFAEGIGAIDADPPIRGGLLTWVAGDIGAWELIHEPGNAPNE